MKSLTIFKFDKKVGLSQWLVIDDVVMGGKSSGKFHLSEEGKGVFQGRVSLENNGGFSSLRYRFDAVNTKPYANIIIRIKGDGKSYKMRFKTIQSDNHSYMTHFSTSKKWETLVFPLTEMEPVFRGQKLDIPKYNSETIEEIAFLVGNKKEENFQLEIDSILLK